MGMAVFGNEAYGSKGFEVARKLNQAFGIEIKDFNSGTVATRDDLVPAQNARTGEMGETAVRKRDGEFDRRIRKKLLRDVDRKAAAAEGHLGSAGAGGKGFADAIFRSRRRDRGWGFKNQVATQQASLYGANQVLFLARLGHHRFDTEIESVDQR